MMSDQEQQYATVEIESPVPGGYTLARHEGRVIFVRHAIAGERVVVRFTDQQRSGYWRAEAVDVERPSPDRVPHRWPQAGPGGVGGGELAHVELGAQRLWKRDAVIDAMVRIGNMGRDHDRLTQLEVHAVPGAADGLGYRTRIELTADADGRAAMYRHRSHDLVPLDSMPLAVPALTDLSLLTHQWRPGVRIDAVAPSVGEPVVLVDGVRRHGQGKRVRERIVIDGQEFHYRVNAAGFWQVHQQAPSVLTHAILDAARAESGMRIVDAYSGAGLFTAPLAAAVGERGMVIAIEADAQAGADARRNAADLPMVNLQVGLVDRELATMSEDPVPDVVVLDPPRAGAGKRVISQLARWGVPRIVYVACDPTALARDVADARTLGLRLESLTGYDIFPHTHHVELVAVFVPAD